MYNVEVSPDVLQSTHHVSLSDGKKTIGLIICDSKGAADPYNISASPNQRSAVRTKSGSTKYDDLEDPWGATAQDDWSGGRAQEDYENDTTKFFDSKRCQTAWNQIYCAPLDYYATGLKDSDTNWPGSVSWRRINGGEAYAIQLELSGPMQAGEIYTLIRRRGTPAAGLVVSLCRNDNGEPGEEIVSHTYTTAEITDVISDWKKFTFDETTLAAGIYWIKAACEEGDEIDSWQVGMTPDAELRTYRYTGQWTMETGYDLYYRICAGDTGRRARFFTYKQLTMAVLQTKAGNPQLYINGDIGMAEDNALALSTVKDSTKSWTANQWKGCKVGIIRGAGVAEHETVWRTIVGNDTTTLTVDQPWQIPHDGNTTYIICDTDQFIEIAPETHGLTGYVTDIVVANDIIFFAQGDEIPIRKMKWQSGAWSSMADEYEHTFGTGEDAETKTVQNCAMYLQTVRETSGLVIWRGQNNDDNHQISISQSAVTDWLDEQIIVAEYNTTINSNNDDVYTDGVDFGKPDDVAAMYKITAGTITGTKLPKFRVMIQASEDNRIYEDVKYVDLDTSEEEIYLSCTSHKRWRRIHVTIIAGTNPALASVKVETVPYSKYIGVTTFNDSYGKITGLAEYPQMINSQYKTLWINREGMIHSISGDGTVDTINLEELATVMEEWNGKTSMNHNVYYYFRWMWGGIQRYYNQQVDAVGPDRDAGLPEDRQGAIADMMAYPGRYFAAIDAGTDGYSSVLLNNNSGWHEIYRAPNAGERITALGYQAIAGERPDRLWISVGDDIVWLVMPSNTLKAVYDSSAEYTHESVLISSWLSIGMVDVIKQWGSMNIMAENLEDEAVYIEADYQVDQDPNWYPMSGHYVISPDQEIRFDDTFGVSAKRLRYRLRLQTNDKTKTPFIKAVVMKTVIKVATKYCFAISCRNVADDVNLRGEIDEISPYERLEQLIDWANNATALQLGAFTYPFNGKRVFIDPPTISNLREKDRPGMLLQLTMNEI